MRIILIIIGFCFGALLEGVAGFGVPGAICSSMMVALGLVATFFIVISNQLNHIFCTYRFDPEDALVYTLIFNTTPVAFGALGIPVTTLASLTGLPVLALSAMMGRQLPIFSLILPSYALLFYAGPRAGLIECWPVALVAGFSFALMQGLFANLVGPELPDLMAGLVSLITVIAFVQFWRPRYRKEYEANINFMLKQQQQEEDVFVQEIKEEKESDAESQVSSRVDKLSAKYTLLAWSPWLLIVVVVIM